MFLIALNCNLSSPWLFIEQKCTGQSARWQAVAAFDIVTELIPFGLLIFIIHDVQMSWEKKLTVSTGFAFRLL